MFKPFVKCEVFAPEIFPADPAKNLAEGEKALAAARERGVDVFVFPGLSLTGVTCGDLFYRDTLLKGAEQALASLAGTCGDMVFAAGLPLRVGGELCDCVVLCAGGRPVGAVPAPAHGRFSEPLLRDEVELCGVTVPFGRELFFRFGDTTLEIRAGGLELDAPAADIVIFAGEEADIAGSRAARLERARVFTARCGCALLEVHPSAGESGGERLYSGHGLIAENGEILAESLPFSGVSAVSDIDTECLCFKGIGQRREGFEIRFEHELKKAPLDRRFECDPFYKNDEQLDELIELQARGIARRLRGAAAKCAIVGVSGGIDSTMALIGVYEACKLMRWDRSNVRAYTMPCFGTTERTRSNAVALCELLGINCETIDITDAVMQHFKNIGQDPGVRNATYENAQARERTQILMDMSNKLGGLVIGTFDLSEMALGWSTFNGDHMAMYGANNSLPKSLIRRLADRYASRCGGELEKVLRDILGTPVSPELLPPAGVGSSQDTEELIGPFDLHDFFIYHTVYRGVSPEKAVFLAENAFAGQYDRETLVHWMDEFLRRFYSAQFKRSCSPEGACLTGVSLSPRGGYEMPSDVSFASLKKVK